MNNLNLFQELEKLLRMESRYCSEDGVLLKNSIVESALALRPDLIRMLLTHKGLKNNFFSEVDGILVFDKVRFQKFVMNKRFLPDSYTSFKNKIGLTGDDGDFLAESREVVLSWPYKDCVLEGGQTKEDAKRNEIFWNEILAPDEINRLTEPKVLTNFVKYDVDGKHEVSEVSEQDNLIIKGNNLLALHSLLRKYRGKVKLIYIDPPYNTGNDGFKYNDSFNHSSWLTFMHNRLTVAQQLLSEDGNIVVQLDFNEVHYAKVLMDKIFGRDNFRNEIIWHYEKWTAGSNSLQKNHDNILLYSKTEKYKFNEIKEITDNLREKYKKGYLIGGGNGSQGLVVYDKTNLEAQEKIKSGKYNVVYADMDGKPLSNVWKIPFINPVSKERTGFNSQKPEILLKRIIDVFTDSGDLVLDYHLGSGTTAAVAHKMGRRYIGVEQMDYIETVAIERLKKVIGKKNKNDMFDTIECDQGGISKAVDWKGGGSFVYCDLAKANQLFVDQIIATNTKEELAIIWNAMQQTGFLSWKVDICTIAENATDFAALSVEDTKRFLIECLDKNLLYIPLSEIDNAEFDISYNDKKLNTHFYSNQ